jgi:cell division protease FtsH
MSDRNSEKTKKKRSPADDLIATLPSATTDDADVATHAPVRPHIASALSSAVLLHAVPKDVKRRLDRSGAIALTIAVPGPDWVEPIAEAAKRRWGDARAIYRDGSVRSEHKPSSGNDRVANALIEGRAVIGISHAPSRFLPSSLMVCADAHVIVAAPGSAVMRRMLKSCARGRVPRQIPPGIAAGLTFHDVIGAFRANASARDVLDNLARTSLARTRVTATDATPTLHNLPGYSGEARQWAMNLADGIARWRRGETAWADLSSAAVLAGPPGTGKTLFAKSLARTCALPIVVTSVGEWFSTTDGTLGDVSRALQQAWDVAKAMTPSIFFIDELDALPNRKTLTNRAREWWTPVIALALTLFDGAVTSREGVVLLGATNHAEHLDPALVRSGRFDRVVPVPLPNLDDLAAILRFHLGDALADADLAPIARLGTSASAADAARWAREARASARAAGRDIRVDDLVAVVAPPDARFPADIRRAAVHEAGHAVVQIALGGAVVHVTIVAAGTSGGRTTSEDDLPDFPTARDIDAATVMTLAGRAAEATFFDAPSAGAESDLRAATEMVCAQHVSAGLAGSLLHLAPTGSASPLLVRDAALRKVVDHHVVRLYAEALMMVRERRAAITAVADALEQHRVLTGAQVKDIVRQHAPIVNKGGSHAK